MNSSSKTPVKRTEPITTIIGNAKALQEFTTKLDVVVKTIVASKGAGIETLLSDLSDLLVTFGNIQLNKKQPWNKDLLPVLSLIGQMPYTGLSSIDFANIARFLTKASKEKVSIIFINEEIIDIAVLLLVYLKHKGNGCRDDNTTASSSVKSKENSKEHTVHEVLRSLAQVTQLSSEKITHLRIDILQVLLHFGHSSYENSDCRGAAIDGLGNIFVTYSSSSREISGENTSINMSLLQSDVEGYENVSLLSDQGKAYLLEELHNKGIINLVENLQLSYAQIKFHSAGVDISIQQKLLVSCLRSVASALTSCTKVNQGLSVGKLKIRDLYISLTNMAIQIKQYIVTSTPLPIIVATSTSDNDENEAAESVKNSIEVKLWRHMLIYLSAIAAYNPVGFISQWPQYLPISTKNLETRCNQLVQYSTAIYQDRSNSESTLLNMKQFISCSTSNGMPKVDSVLFSAAVSPIPWIRAAALAVLRSILTGISQRLDSVIESITKIFRLVVVLFSREKHELVIQELLDLSKVLLSIVSLESLNQKSSLSSVTLSAKNSSPSKDAKLNVLQLKKVIEELSFTLFFQIMLIATDVQQFGTSEGTPSGITNLINQMACQWLNEFSKNDKKLSTFSRALSMPYYLSPSLSSDPALKSAVNNNIETKPVVVDSWRKSTSVAVPTATINAHVATTLEAMVQKKSFISAIVELSTNATLNAACSNAFSLSLRNLLIAIMTNYSTSYMNEMELITTTINQYAASSNAALRLQASRILTLLLEQHLPSRPLFDTLEDISVATISLKQIITILLNGCYDSDHQVKGQSMSAFGCLSATYWEMLSNTLPTALTLTKVPATIKQSSSLQKIIILSLLENVKDKVGTVRCASYKTIGELLLNKGLCLSETIKHIEQESIASEDTSLIVKIASIAQEGCADSKLAVRIQSVWAMGNLLIVIFPFRLLLESVGHQSDSSVAIESYSWLNEIWTGSLSIQVKLLSDSEKIISTAVRCLGLLIGGLNPYAAVNQVQYLDTIRQFKQLMIDQFKSRGHIEDVTSFINDDMQLAVNEQPHKLMFSVCQGLGYLTWVTVYYRNSSNNATNSVIEEELFAIMFESVGIQLHMLQTGPLKLQLQAVQLILLFVINIETIMKERRDDVVFTSMCHNLLIRILDTFCTVCSSFIFIKPKAVKSTTKPTVTAELSEEELENLKFQENRSNLIHKIMIVLLWSTLRTLSQSEALLSRLLDTISFYSKQVETYLKSWLNSNVIVDVSDLSIGLPMAEHKQGSLLSLQPTNGRSFKEIVELIVQQLSTFNSTVKNDALSDMIASLSSIASNQRIEGSSDNSKNYNLFDGLAPATYSFNKATTATSVDDEDEI